MLIRSVFATAILVVVSHVALAQEVVSLRVLHVRGGLTRQEAREVVRSASLPGVTFRIASWKTEPKGTALGNITEAFPRYAKHFAIGPGIAVVLAPPLASGGSQGMASPICGSKVAVAVGRWVGVPDVLLPAKVILTHELAHALGALHGSQGLMSVDPVGTSYRLGWKMPSVTAENVTEMVRCRQ